MKRFALLSVFFFSILAFSCKKDYTGSVMIWYQEALANSLSLMGSSQLYYYVDNELVGIQDAGVYFSTVPECGTDGLVTITKELGNSLSKTFNVVVKDQDNLLVFNANLNFEADECYILELNRIESE